MQLLTGRDGNLMPIGGEGGGTTPSAAYEHGETATVTPVERSLAILSAFTPHAPWLGNQELVELTGIPAPTVSRLARAMATLGYLRYCATQRKYRLAAAVLSLGYAAVANATTTCLMRPAMQALADATDTSIVLGTREQLSAQQLSHQRAPFQLFQPPDSVGSPHCTRSRQP